MDSKLSKIHFDRIRSLIRAERLDAWRVIPRLLVVGYIIWICVMISWFKSIPFYTIEECNATALIQLMDTGLSKEEARDIACMTTDVIGGPSTSVTVLVTTVCGLATAIFGFYAGTGRKWDKMNHLETPPKLTAESQKMNDIRDKLKQIIDELS